MVFLRVTTEIHPTESEEKVRLAVESIFDITLKRENDFLIGESKRIESLNILKEKLKNQAIRDSSRNIFLENVVEKKLKFGLNKQVASVGAVNFLKSSKLGVIKVEIEDEDITGIIDLLAPSTL